MRGVPAVLVAGYVLGALAVAPAGLAALAGYSLLSLMNLIVALRFGVLRGRFEHPLQLAAPVLLVELVVAPVGVLGFTQYTPDWLDTVPNPVALFTDAMFLTALGMACLLAGEWAASWCLVTRHDGGRAVPPPTTDGQAIDRAVPLLLMASVVASILNVNTLASGGLSASDSFQERRVITAGTGYTEVLAVGGYVAVMLQAYKATSTRRSRHVAALVGMIALAGLPYALMGQRGGVLYPAIFAFLVAATRGRAPATLLRSLPAAGVLLLALDYLTAEFRAALPLGELPFLREGMAMEFSLNVRAFGHIELLAMVQSLGMSGTQLQPTLLASLCNWLPRALFPDKGLTTGPVLAAFFSPLWLNEEGLHLSSYTTGPFVELAFAGGLIAVVVGLSLYGFAVGWFARWYQTRPPSAQAVFLFVYESYLWGWDVWVDDLGGVVNKQVVILAYALALYLLRPAPVLTPAPTRGRSPGPAKGRRSANFGVSGA